MAARMLARGIRNKLQNKPLSVSFEITHACTANCWHCNWGGPIKEERLGAAEYAAICKELRPVVSHASGGEPLARGDVYEIVDAMTNKGGLPWMIVVTNSSNLTPERFFKLKESGMHQLSTSLDFPDERHDEFRRIPGLFDRMSKVVPEIARRSGDKDDILLNVCITAWNYMDIGDMVRVAKAWGVPINFSVYTHLRVQDRSGLIEGDGLDGLAASIQEVIDLRNQGYPVYTTPTVLWKFHRFLTEKGIPGCQAGRRFLVINPDGRLTPCAMVMAYFDKQEDMLEHFTKQNTCEQCYISTRANTEKNFKEFVQDNTDALKRMLIPWKN
jgi:MoaA/NifB/PqqE/SkfB family radical SAM enzyme